MKTKKVSVLRDSKGGKQVSCWDFCNLILSSFLVKNVWKNFTFCRVGATKKLRWKSAIVKAHKRETSSGMQTGTYSAICCWKIQRQRKNKELEEWDKIIRSTRLVCQSYKKLTLTLSGWSLDFLSRMISDSLEELIIPGKWRKAT